MTAQTEAVRSAWSTSHCPYQGLMAYTAERARYFFGRTRDIELIASNARAHRFCLLYGPSGVGKSSLLQAGVVHAIREETANRRTHFGADAVETVACYLKEWRDDPMAALWASVEEGFAHEQLGVAPRADGQDVVGAVRALCEEHDVDLVLILDQFEEFFLYHPNDVRLFARELARLVGPDVPANVLISIREDALSLVDEFEGIVPGVFAHTLKLELLDEPSARAATVEPLRTFNTEVPESERRDIEPELVDRLMREVRIGSVQVDSSTGTGGGPEGATSQTADGTVRIEAPFLQLVLTRLWDEEAARGSTLLRASTLRELGGAQEIVRQHLDRVMREFSAPEMAVLADAFGHLVTPSGSKIAHRPSDLAEFSGHDPQQVAGLLRRLAEGDQRILRDVPPPMDEPHAEPRYEIFHDVLALAVLDWRRRFLAEARSKREQSELLAEKERSEKVAREARSRLRKARALIAAMALLLVACVALAGWAVRSRSSAQDAKEQSQKSEHKALKSEAAAVLSDRVNRFNQVVRADPSRALKQGLAFDLDPESDPDGLLQAAFRGAMDAADTDVIVDLHQPVLMAGLVGSDSLVAVTNDGRVVTWDVTSQDPLRVEDQPRIDEFLDQGEAVHAVTTASGDYLVVATDEQVSSIDLESGAVVTLDLRPHLQLQGNRVPDLAVPEGGASDQVLVTNPYGFALIADVAEGTTRQLPRFGKQIEAATIDPTASYVAAIVRGTTSKVVVRDATSGRSVASMPLTSNLSSAPSVFTGALRFSTAGRDGDPSDPVLVIQAQGLQSEVARWDVLSADAPVPLGDDFNWRQVYGVADLATGPATNSEVSRLAVAGDKTVTIFDDQGVFVGQTAPAQDWVTDVQADPADAGVFALAANEGYVELYRTNLNPPQPMWTFRGHRGAINDLAFSDDGQHLVTGGADGTVRVWRLPPQMDYEWSVADWILGARFTPDGKYVFGYSPLGSYVTREAEDGTIDYAQADLSGQTSGMDPAPDDVRAVVIDYYCSVPVEVSVRHKVDAVPLEAPDESDGCTSAAAWNPDPARHQIVGGTLDDYVIAWDADTGKITATNHLDQGNAKVVALAISGDGSKVVVGTADGPDGGIHVLDADDLAPIDAWPVDTFTTLDVSADGRYVVTGGGSRRVVTVWDTEDAGQIAHGQAEHVFDEATGTLGQVAISPDPDASRVAVPTSAGMVYVWDRDSGRLLATMKRHSDAADEATFDPNDINRMFSAGDDGFMVAYACEVCALDVDELKDAAADRLAQEVDVGS